MPATMIRVQSNKWIKNQLATYGSTYKTVLNLGCGNDDDKEGGAYSKYFKAQSIVCSDIKKTRATTEIFPAERIPYPDGAFNFVFCNWVIYKTDWYGAIKEIERVLAESGRFIISYANSEVPFSTMAAIDTELYVEFNILARKEFHKVKRGALEYEAVMLFGEKNV